MKDELDEDEAGAGSSGSLPESTTSSYSNPRASRNLAEKQRRDNLNTHISLMSQLVPQVFRSPRRMDKISILRLAAAFLRTHYTVGSGSSSFLPSKYGNFDFEDYVIEQTVGNEGFFLVVTGLGKIVYISRHVEEQLGHAQLCEYVEYCYHICLMIIELKSCKYYQTLGNNEKNELLGQSLYSFVCSDDHDELTRNLVLAGSQPSTSNAITNVSEDGSSSSDGRDASITEEQPMEQRRSFDVRMFQRAVNKRDHRQYECLHVTGLLRRADACRSQLTNSNTSKHREISSTSNDVVFVGIARMMKKRNITELSLLEASKDEYVTRHLVDGRIIYCDHRISVVAGYMTEEVSGLSAFKFMHKDDVRWTMIALRQMYDRGEGFGSSCYRLLSKTGQFIYLRTHGYLEFDKTTQTVESFVCVNTLVSEKEGDELVKDMKNRFSAVTSGPARIMVPPITDSSLICSVPDTKAAVEDPQQLEVAITRLISDLPSPSTMRDRASPSPLPNNQYFVAAMYSRGLPPASIQANQIGITRMHCQQQSADRKWSPIKESGQSSVETATPFNDNDDSESIIDPSSSLQSVQSPRSDDVKVNFHDTQSIPDTSASHQDGKISDTEMESQSNVNTIATKSSSVSPKKSDDRHAPEKRASRKRIAKTIADRSTSDVTVTIGCSTRTDTRQENEIGNADPTISSSCETIGRPTVVCATARAKMDVTNVSGSSTIGHRGKPESMQEYYAINEEPRYKLKRTRHLLVDNSATTCKRKISESYLGSNHESSPEENRMANNEGTYYEENEPAILSTFEPEQVTLGMGNLSSPALPVDVDQPIDEDRATCSLELPSSCLPTIDLYQSLNSTSLDSVSSHQLEDLQDVPDDMLSSTLETSPDLMEMFRNLPPGMDIEQTIDNMNFDRFAVKEPTIIQMGRVHSNMEKDITQRDERLDAIKSEYEDPVLPQTHKDDFFQLQADHNEAKEMFKTLQQDCNKYTAQYGTACNATLVYDNRYPKNSHADVSLHFS